MTLWFLLTACGAPGYTAILRPLDEVAVLKIKGGSAWKLYDGLTGESVVEVCSLRGCKRAGRSVVCSTMNLRDPVVCEMRLTPNGTLLPPDLSLYHSREDNRNYGASTTIGDALVVDGMALTAMGAWTEQPVEALWLRILDAPTGHLIVAREPRP